METHIYSAKLVKNFLGALIGNKAGLKAKTFEGCSLWKVYLLGYSR
jgi:hypothetical protein